MTAQLAQILQCLYQKFILKEECVSFLLHVMSFNVMAIPAPMPLAARLQNFGAVAINHMRTPQAETQVGFYWL